MSLSPLRIVFAFALVLVGGIYCSAQNIENPNNRPSVLSRPDEKDEDKPKGLKESIEKLRIERDKKDYEQMLGRGEEAVKISEQLEKGFAENGRLSEKELGQLATVEKLITKIRSELGGNDDDDENELARAHNSKLSLGDAVKTLRNSSVALFDELKKMTRFSISAAAIQSSNAILKVVRFLRFSK
jgi:hypothetical protein